MDTILSRPLGQFILSKGVTTSIYAMRDSFREAGFKILGSGSFAFVIEEDPSYPTVLKFSKDLDDRWLDYAHWLIKGERWQSNLCFPVIHDLYCDSTFYVAEVERLVPLLRDVDYEGRWGDGWNQYVFGQNVLPPPLADKQMVETLNQLRDLYPALKSIRNCYVDLGSTNVMKRDCGQWVITDPFSN